MPRSMTGIGIASAEDDDLCVTVELRSVNNRFLDLNLRAPRGVMSRENDFRRIIGEKISRGRITAFVNEEQKNDSNSGIKLDKAKAKGYVDQLEKLRKEMKLGGWLQIGSMIGVNELFRYSEDDDKRQKLWRLTSKALADALESLVELSLIEGNRLTEDILERKSAIESELGAIKRKAAEQVEQYSDRLKTRLEELLSDNRLEPSRLEMEIALAADRLDISEEIIRLESHLSMLGSTLALETPIGKKLNFVLQEIGREANTIASKAWLVDLSQSAIRIKELIEQIREQVQNIE